MKISMIGYGNMGKALCQGLVRNPDYHLHVAAPSLMPGQLQPNLLTSSDNLALLQNPDVLILAVKPAQMVDVLIEIYPHIPSTLPVISIAAGLDMSWYAKRLPQHTPVIRAIPNLAAACQQSATPLLANTWVSASQHALATDLFLKCGQIMWTEHEKDLDMITALAGSGLAYLFAFTQAMSEGAITLGLSSETANRFAIQTLAGAASLATLPEHSLRELQQRVTSKAGTTAAALDVFDQYQLSNIVLAAMQAALTRSQTLRSEES